MKEEYKPRFKQNLKEMAHLGETKSNVIKVESQEHLPSHLHAISKDGAYNARITIPEGEILSYKFKKREMKPAELREVKDWLVSKSPRKNSKTGVNVDDALFAFEILNPDLFKFTPPAKKDNP